jgi:hypothetical protein
MGENARHFRTSLHTNYVLKDKEPFERFGFVRPEWEAFKSLRSTPEAEALRERNIALQRLNTHAHHLGSAGYEGKKAEWAKLEEECAQSGTPVPFSDIVEPRARAWVLARTKKEPDGRIVVPNTATAQVVSTIVSPIYVSCYT